MAKAVEIGDDKEIRLSATGKKVVAKCRPNKFGVKVRKKFLTHLSASCNVRASAKAAGCGIGVIYYWRHADPEFAAAFDAALEAGYMQIELVLIERAQHGDKANRLTEEDYDEMPDPANVDTELAIKLMSMHERRVKTGQQRGGGAARRKATREETDAAILKRLKVLQIRFEHGED